MQLIPLYFWNLCSHFCGFMLSKSRLNIKCLVFIRSFGYSACTFYIEILEQMFILKKKVLPFSNRAQSRTNGKIKRIWDLFRWVWKEIIRPKWQIVRKNFFFFAFPNSNLIKNLNLMYTFNRLKIHNNNFEELNLIPYVRGYFLLCFLFTRIIKYNWKNKLYFFLFFFH